MHCGNFQPRALSRRQMLIGSANGFGALAFGVLHAGGNGELAASAPFTPSELTKDGVNIPFGMLFAVSFFMGFEATALFRDECKNPDVTIPRATYGSIIFIGMFDTSG